MTDSPDPFVDDRNGVPDDALLYRRVSWGSIGGRCPPGQLAELSGNCFRDYPDAQARALGYPGPCMSVGVGTVLQARGLQPEAMLVGHAGYGLAVVRAGDLRRLCRFDGTACEQGVMLSPTDEEPWHGVVFDKSGSARSKAVAVAVQRKAEWHVPLIGG